MWASVTVMWTDRAVIRRLDGSTVYFTPAIDTAARTLRLVRYGGAADETPLAFEYAQPDAEHLTLRLADRAREALTIELRRMQPEEFPLLSSRHRWTW
jgi:hypothetical protein